MTSRDSGQWSPLPPEFVESHPAATPTQEEAATVDEPAEVVGLGAVCDLHRVSADGRTVSFSVSEFALVKDGRRVVLRGALGFTTAWGSGVPATSPVWSSFTVQSLTQEVLAVVLPDDDDGEDHPWEWLAELARDRGIVVTADDLRGVPYEVELTDRVLALMAPA
ncbi:hypothetical protein E1212_06660 [Jiangella ureilytica]|uniref:Uncharacterized protein n=1 Tax=Jiangella ureilytica TaxID=2530374 RepID=A0A4V2XXJ1_9ACTN|nr:hypothetical protein [Jiangella ureilytica]TDC53095.1 hypothetical protein E1212_06660 [Jiangella ureilytica]